MTELTQQDAVKVIDLINQIDQYTAAEQQMTAIIAQVSTLQTMRGFTRVIDQDDFLNITADLDHWLSQIQSENGGLLTAVHILLDIPESIDGSVSDIPF